MKRYAIIQNGVVLNVINYESQPSSPPPGFDDGIIAIESESCSIGWTYTNGSFMAPQPYPSWVWNNGYWEAPTNYPLDGNIYEWNEVTLSWVIKI